MCAAPFAEFRAFRRCTARSFITWLWCASLLPPYYTVAASNKTRAAVLSVRQHASYCRPLIMLYSLRFNQSAGVHVFVVAF